MSKKLTLEEFIQKAILIHGIIYDYSKVIYVNSWTKVCIICPIHGEFWQTPNNHLREQGCYKCNMLLFNEKRKLTIQQFIQKAIKIHGNKYGYNKIHILNGNLTKVNIDCPTHGEFIQIASNHLRGKGCPYCSNNKNYTTEEFISKAISIHGLIFDYSETNYINSYTKVKIICPKHGEFYQVPGSHLSGTGCPKCKSSKGERFLIKILEENNIKYKHQYIIPNQSTLYRYDFYLPELNILIEFHGGQHYKPIKHFGGIDYFNYIKECDAFKQSLAREYKIPIIYFNYKHLRQSRKQFEELVVETLNKQIKR